MKLILLLITVLLTVGCSEKIIYVTRYVTVEDSWVDDCNYAKPPERLTYNSASPQVRSALIALSYINQLEFTSECNTRMNAIRNFNERGKDHNKEQDKRYRDKKIEVK